MTEANNPSLTSWLPVSPDSHFPIQNLPFGIFQTPEKSARAATIIGHTVIDLAELQAAGYLTGLPEGIFHQKVLNDFMALGREKTRDVREQLSRLFQAENATLRDQTALHQRIFHAVEEVELLLPVRIGDYTDFYSSEYHAYNVGVMFRDPANALLPNWKHLPVGYHGRASSIVVSGTPLHRPKGQTKEDDQSAPVFGPTRRLDFELELAFVTCKPTALGTSIPVDRAEEHIFGLLLFNDWSARDIQKWEYVPLGPFLAKNFGSSVSPWVVTLDALEPFRTAGPVQEPAVLPYLRQSGAGLFDIHLEVGITPEGAAEQVVSRSNTKYLYWSMAQQLAHHTVNGCNIQVGDLYASGTISGPEPGSYGSMLELAWKGTKPLKMTDGTERRFIHDGDTVTMRGYAQGDGYRVGFGAVEGKVLPAV